MTDIAIPSKYDISAELEGLMAEAPASTEVAVVEPRTSTDIMPSRDELVGLMQMAVALSNAGIVPAALRREPANVFLVLLTARDLGVKLTTAVREFHVIEGRVTVSPKAKLAMARQQHVARIWPDPNNNREHATWYGYRYDDPDLNVFTSEFTMDDARGVPVPKWTGPSGNRKKVDGTLAEKDNWVAYPKRMLSWRALGYLLDDLCPEVGTGLYSPDEIGAVTDSDGEPITLDTVEMPEGFEHPVAADEEEDTGPKPTPPDRIASLQARIDGLPVRARGGLLDEWKRLGIPPLKKMTTHQDGLAAALISGYESRARSGQFADPAPVVVDHEPIQPEVLDNDSIDLDDLERPFE
jgi:hypothetical protein